MNRRQAIVTGAATAIALLLVLLSVDFSKLGPSFRQLEATPIILATILLAANLLFAFLRFGWTLGALGTVMDTRTAVYAFTLGNIASQFLFNIIGQSLTRAVVLQTIGVPMSATVAATYLERLIALATVAAGAAAAALALFGSLGFELHTGGAYFLSLAIGVACTLAVAGTRALTQAFAPDELREMVRLLVRLLPALGISMAAHLAMFAAYFVLVWKFAAGVDPVKLGCAIVIVMFAAGLPISWAGWGLREFGAVYALNAVGVPSEAAVIVAVIVGAISMVMLLAAGGAVAMDAWLRPSLPLKSLSTKEISAGTLAPSDPFFFIVLGILTACLIFFQLRVPSGNSDITVNAADPLAMTAVFFAAILARSDRFLELFPKPVLWSVCGLAGVLAVGLVVAWAGPGVTQWALLNRILGFFILLGYAAIPGLVAFAAGERGHTIVAQAFVISAVVICAVQLIAYAIHLGIAPLPSGFFGYLFYKGQQLEGYAQNSNAFAFQLLMAIAVLIGLGLKQLSRTAVAWAIVAAILFVTVAIVRSRAGILCGLGTIPLAIALQRLSERGAFPRKTATIALLAGAVVVLLGAYFWDALNGAVIEPLTRFLRPHASESDAERLQSTILGFRAWLEHPVLGNGLGTFLLQRELAGLPSLVIHSIPVWFMAEMGLVGLAGYIFFVGSLLYCGVSGVLRRETHAQGLLIALAVFVLMGLVHDLFFQRTFWFAIGLLLVNGQEIVRHMRGSVERQGGG